ncbi:MAG: hypothetical protein AAGG51_28555 [Cyanobacteria bacterium P01_G01_bin.54]
MNILDFSKKILASSTLPLWIFSNGLTSGVALSTSSPAQVEDQVSLRCELDQSEMKLTATFENLSDQEVLVSDDRRLPYLFLIDGQILMLSGRHADTSPFIDYISFDAPRFSILTLEPGEAHIFEVELEPLSPREHYRGPFNTVQPFGRMSAQCSLQWGFFERQENGEERWNSLASTYEAVEVHFSDPIFRPERSEDVEVSCEQTNILQSVTVSIKNVSQSAVYVFDDPDLPDPVLYNGELIIFHGLYPHSETQALNRTEVPPTQRLEPGETLQYEVWVQAIHPRDYDRVKTVAPLRGQFPLKCLVGWGETPYKASQETSILEWQNISESETIPFDSFYQFFLWDNEREQYRQSLYERLERLMDEQHFQEGQEL